MSTCGETGHCDRVWVEMASLEQQEAKTAANPEKH